MKSAYPGQQSNEANKKQLQLARDQGDAYANALKEMTDREADSGKNQAAGDYIVGYAVEKAEGMHVWATGKLRWQEPGKENAHIEVAVQDKLDGRFMPYLNVEVSVYDKQGQELGTKVHPFLWHPWLYHYGSNWQLPSSGLYGIEIRIEPPKFARHDKINGTRHSAPITTRFDDIQIETGRKLS